MLIDILTESEHRANLMQMYGTRNPPEIINNKEGDSIINDVETLLRVAEERKGYQEGEMKRIKFFGACRHKAKLLLCPPGPMKKARPWI